MSIPATITAALAALQTEVAAADPIRQASHATITALQLNAGNLVHSIDAALTATSALDTWSPPVDPASMVAGFNGVVVAAQDQAALSLQRGVVGRVASNLDQLG